MGPGKTLLLGFIAGATILLGMPLGRMRRPSEGLRVMLNSLAIGTLLFLVWDVLSAAWEPIDEALAAHHEDASGLGTPSATACCSPAASASDCSGCRRMRCGWAAQSGGRGSSPTRSSRRRRSNTTPLSAPY